jgi:hypothetical protein
MLEVNVGSASSWEKRQKDIEDRWFDKYWYTAKDKVAIFYLNANFDTFDSLLFEPSVNIKGMKDVKRAIKAGESFCSLDIAMSRDLANLCELGYRVFISDYFDDMDFKGNRYLEIIPGMLTDYGKEIHPFLNLDRLIVNYEDYFEKQLRNSKVQIPDKTKPFTKIDNSIKAKLIFSWDLPLAFNDKDTKLKWRKHNNDLIKRVQKLAIKAKKNGK